MCQVNCVAIMVKLHAEGKCVIVAGVLALHRVLIVANVSAPAEPALARAFGLGF
jgi:hypothetical protein